MILYDGMENEFEQKNIIGIKLNIGTVSVN
jgi:hypothetical protein